MTRHANSRASPPFRAWLGLSGTNRILSDRATRQDRYGLGNVFEFSRPSAVVNGLNTARTDAWTVGIPRTLRWESGAGALMGNRSRWTRWARTPYPHLAGDDGTCPRSLWVGWG
ncbi:MAG UNVERIFIED_CONTAM: hypothetical protein LVT10_26845 [Anaerolineae bacterium]